MYPANDYRNYLQHSAKGTHWKSGHKYKYIKNGRYYYDDEGSGDGSSVGSKVKSTVGKVSSAMNGIKDKALSSFGAARDEARAIKSDYQSERAYLSTRREAASTALGGAINRRNERKKANAAKNKPNKKKQSSFSKLSSKFKKALETTKKSANTKRRRLKRNIGLKAGNTKKSINRAVNTVKASPGKAKNAAKSAVSRAATNIWKKSDTAKQKSKARLRKLGRDILRPARQRLNKAKLDSARKSIKKISDTYNSSGLKALNLKPADKYRVTNRATWKNRDRDKTDYKMWDKNSRPKPSKKSRRRANVNKVVTVKAHKPASGGGISTTKNRSGNRRSGGSSRKF